VRRLLPLLVSVILLVAADPLLPTREDLACVADPLLVRGGLAARCGDGALADGTAAESGAVADGRSRRRTGARSTAIEDSIENLLSGRANRATPGLVVPILPPRPWQRLPYPDPLLDRIVIASRDRDVAETAEAHAWAPPQPVTSLRLTTVPIPADADESRRLLDRHYPAQLRESGVGGTVVLALAIDARGRVRDQQLVSGSGQAALDAAAVEIARSLRFTPAQEGGRRIATRIVFPFVFNP
jgi:TonB family protein